MRNANEREAKNSTPAEPADEYVAPALTVLGHGPGDLTESHHHHHRHWVDPPAGFHAGLPAPVVPRLSLTRRGRAAA